MEEGFSVRHTSRSHTGPANWDYIFIQAFEKQGVSGNLEQTKQLSAPEDPTNNPFRLLKEELQIPWVFFPQKD